MNARPQPKDARLNFLVSSAMKQELEAEAAKARISLGEFVRRRIEDAPLFDAALQEAEEAFVAALTALADDAQAVIARMEASEAKLERYLAEAPAREAAIRRRVQAEMTSERQALLAHLAGAPA